MNEQPGSGGADWGDRLVDAALHELHGQAPPDLSARVLLALQEAPAGPLPLLHRSPQRGSWRAIAAVLLAALCLGAFGAWALHRLVPAAAPQAPFTVLEVALVTGELACYPPAQATPSAVLASPYSLSPVVQPPVVQPLVVQLGSRFRSQRASAFRLGTFGTLAASQDTELEVVDMGMGMDNKQGIVMAASLTLAVVAGTVTWHTLTRTDSAQAGETVRLEAPLAAGGAAAASGDVAQLRQRNRELEQELATLRDQLARRGAEPQPAVAASVAPDAPLPAVAGPMFDDAQFAAALAKIDWATMGEVTKEMAPLLAELVAAMGEEGAEVPMDVMGKLQQLNGKLLAQVPAMLEAGMPGYGPNGVYTHPLVVANTLASTLAASGTKLTPAQQQSLSGIVAAFAKETQQIAGASREFPIEQLLEEVEMKDRFYREMSGLLTPEQLAKVAPGEVDGYDGSNLFGSGLVTQSSSVPVPAKDAADFARSASNHLAEHLGLDEAAAAQVRTVLAQAMAAPELWNQRSDARELQLRMFRSGRATNAMRAQLQWMRQIQQQVPLTPAQRKKLTGMRHVLVPLPR